VWVDERGKFSAAVNQIVTIQGQVVWDALLCTTGRPR
jgi:hypothetical protein